METQFQRFRNSSTDFLKLFSERLKAARVRLDLSQSKLAEKCGFKGPSKISNYEQGLNFPHLEEVPLIASALGVSQGWLLGDDILTDASESRALPDELQKWLSQSESSLRAIREFLESSSVSSPALASHQETRKLNLRSKEVPKGRASESQKTEPPHHE